MQVSILHRKPFNSIVTGFFFHLIGQSLQTLINNEYLLALSCCIGWFFIIKGFLKFKRIGLCIPFVGLYKLLFILYLIVCIIMIIRGYLIDYPFQWISLQGMINMHFFFPNYILPYFMPIIAFIPFKFYNFKLIIKYSIIISFISIILFIIYYNRIVYSSTMLAKGLEGEYGFGAKFAYIYIPMAFVVLCKKYIGFKLWLINTIALTLSLLIFAVAARRGDTLITSCLILFNLYIYLKSITRNKKIISYVIIIIMSFFSIYYIKNSSDFNYIQERGMEDTRSEVDKALLSQMTETELFFGKGLNGRYYKPSISNEFLDGWRYGSETGFYNLVLKGGYLMAILYIVLLAYPGILGVFRSNNILCKALGLYIILSLIELYPFGWLSFNMKFLIIWIGVVLCYKRKVRRLTDEQIFTHFFN